LESNVLFQILSLFRLPTVFSSEIMIFTCRTNEQSEILAVLQKSKYLWLCEYSSKYSCTGNLAFYEYGVHNVQTDFVVKCFQHVLVYCRFHFSSSNNTFRSSCIIFEAIDRERDEKGFLLNENCDMIFVVGAITLSFSYILFCHFFDFFQCDIPNRVQSIDLILSSLLLFLYALHIV